MDKIHSHITFTVDKSAFQTLMDSKLTKGLGKGWTDLIYNGFHEVWPTCSLYFNTNYLSTKKNPKKTEKYVLWSGDGACKVPGCINVNFTVRELPHEGDMVNVNCFINGQCIHNQPNDDVEIQNRRQLKGKRRSQTVDDIALLGNSCNDFYMMKLGDMSEDECRAGNTTECQTTGVLRQAVYEKRRNQRLHEDIIRELEIQQDTCDAAIGGTHFSGYIQNLSLNPFNVTFYMERQVRFYIDQIKKSPPVVLHFDATGSVLSNIKNKRVFLYSMIIGGNNVPIMEFLANDHSSDKIQCQLLMFNRNVSRVNNGKRIVAQYLVVDFSFAMIHAVVWSFNGCSLSWYLKECFNYLLNKSKSLEDNKLTIIVLCKAHIMKAMSRKLKQVEPRRNVRQVTLIYFNVLQHCATISSAQTVYQDIHRVLCCAEQTDEVANSKQLLERKAMGREVEAHLQYEDDDDSENKTLDKLDSEEIDDEHSDYIGNSGTTLREMSPFTTFFGNMESFDSNEPTTLNTDYSPQAFKCITDIMHVFPLWSATLQNKGIESDIRSICLTNGAVEAHFKLIKHGRMRGQNRMRPREFIDAELKYTRGKLNEQVTHILILIL